VPDSWSAHFRVVSRRRRRRQRSGSNRNLVCRHLLAAKLRTADQDAAAGSVAEMARIIGQIRSRWPEARIVLRADGGFARESLMAWCEENGVDYLFGLQGNVRLVAAVAAEFDEAKLASDADGGNPQEITALVEMERAA
jgi:hypothetical protein